MTGSQKESSAPLISPAHRAALAARLLVVEQNCRQMELFLDGYAGIYYQYQGVFPDGVRQTIRDLVAEILRGIARIKSDLALPQRQIEVSRFLAAHLSEVWVTLAETNAPALRGHGEAPKELNAYLGPHVDGLLDLVARLREIIDSRSESTKAGAGAGP